VGVTTAVGEHRMPVQIHTRLATWSTTIQSMHVASGSSHQRIRREPHAVRGRHDDTQLHVALRDVKAI